MWNNGSMFKLGTIRFAPRLWLSFVFVTSNCNRLGLFAHQGHVIVVRQPWKMCSACALVSEITRQPHLKWAIWTQKETTKQTTVSPRAQTSSSEGDECLRTLQHLVHVCLFSPARTCWRSFCYYFFPRWQLDPFLILFFSSVCQRTGFS